MNEECLVCKAPLEYLETDELMECVICHRKENSKTRCIHGHYVCNECHTAGMDAIIGLCLEETSKNPVEIIEKMMSFPFCHMHGFVRDNFGVEMEQQEIVCTHAAQNNQCIGARCPFSKANHRNAG